MHIWSSRVKLVKCPSVHPSIRPCSVNIFKTVRLWDCWAEVDETWHVFLWVGYKTFRKQKFEFRPLRLVGRSKLSPDTYGLMKFQWLMASVRAGEITHPDRADFYRAMWCISAVFAVMQCLSVRPSRSWITSKRINMSSKFFNHRVATPF